MTSDRPYQPALSETEALAELRRNAGSRFAAAVVEAFLDVRSRAVHDRAGVRT
jgi:HD-GYP domain-containing protein (c-di-GMP phosphodiesterase class II)